MERSSFEIEKDFINVGQAVVVDIGEGKACSQAKDGEYRCVVYFTQTTKEIGVS